jgi:hypothetical protein
MRRNLCNVYFKDEGVYLFGMSPNPGDTISFVFRQPVIKLPPPPDPVELGRAICRILDMARTPVLQGGDQGFMDAIRAVGLRGSSSLDYSSRMFTVYEDASQVSIHAWRHRTGGSTIEDRTCPRDPNQIGKILLEMAPYCQVSDPLTPPRFGNSYLRAHPEGFVDRPVTLDAAVDAPEPFGYKLRWFVVDTMNAGDVVSALGLKSVRPASWSIHPYRHDGIFVSPSILGWTFVLGLYTEPDWPDFRTLLEDLSRQLGEVHYYCTHRVVEFHGWVKAIGGRIVRGYAYLGERGELIMDEGELTSEEVELGFDRFQNRRSEELGDWENMKAPMEKDVMRIAGKWSLNPQELGAYEPEGPGYLGRRDT